MAMKESVCIACPRHCGARRTDETGSGYCGVGALPVIARAALHYGEEPCISGTRGSGTVFFSGCNLRCVFCQNQEISRGSTGQAVSVRRLREIMLELQAQGAHNINLVTASHYTDAVAAALRDLPLEIPVVYNSSGYDSITALDALDGLVQVYMPDMKYLNAPLAARLSGAPDYPEVARAAITAMYRQVGPIEFDADGMLKKGVLIRHLMLPGQVENTLDVIDWVADTFPRGSVLLSLMAQYTPMGDLEKHPDLQRPVTMEEYDRALSYLEFCGITEGYFQEPEAVGTEMIPDFDGTGV